MSNKQWEIGSIIGLDDVIRWDGKVSPTELEQVINQLRAGEITVAEAQKWAESITLTLAGDARGSVNIDGSGNVSLTVTLNKATQAEAESGESNTRFMTPLRTKQLVDASGLAKDSVLTSHVEDKSNPHNVTKTQIGLGNVDNVKQATKTEFDSHVADKSNPHSTTASQVGAYSKTESDARFETPAGSQEKVNAHADLTNNPHGVTKAQVGLGSVPNNSMASQAEAEAGTSNARFMSPQRTKQAIDVHANSTNNPHSVTKTQVGLGSVPNYGVSSQAEAESGTANNRFMTPLRVREAFDKFIETVSTVLNNFMARRDNPHQVTKSQVGLGNVDNVQQAPATRTISTGTGLTGGGNLTANRTLSISTATEAEAETGTSNTKVMTPLRTKEAVESAFREKTKELLPDNAFDLPFPWYIAHRGAMNIYQEHTLLAYRNCIARGNRFLEIDVQQSLDGGLIIMHDTTMDRTTDGNWSINTLSTNYISSKVVTDKMSGEYNGFGYSPQRIPLLVEVFTELGRNANYIIESKDRKSARKIAELAKQMRLEDYIIIQSYDLDELKTVSNSGIRLMYLANNATSSTFQEMKNNNINYFGCNKTNTDVYVTSSINQGLKTFIYAVNNRFERDRFLSLGVQGFFSDDPFYLDGSSDAKNVDTFREKVFMDGMVPSYGTDRGIFNTDSLQPYSWGFPNINNTEDGRDFVLQGWLGELPNEFTFEVNLNYKGDYITGWGSVAFCTPIDYFDDNKTELTSGYHLSCTRAGGFILWKIENGNAIEIDRATGSRIENPASKKIRITVSNSQVKVESIDDGIVLTTNDTTFRNGYLHFGRRATAISYSGAKLIS